MSIGKKISLLLLLMLAAAVANICLIFNYQNTQKHDAHIVNVAGRQRMLSQKMLILVLSIARGNNRDRRLLEEVIKLYDDSLESLSYGGKPMGTDIPSAPVSMEGLFYRNKALWQPFKEKAGTIIRERRNSKIFKESVSYIRLNNDSLLSISDEITGQFEKIFSYKTFQLQVALMAMLGFDMLVFSAGCLFGVKLVRPIKALSRAAAEMGRGEFMKEIEITSTDEIGELCRTFNKMVMNLEGFRNSLVSAKDYTDTILGSMIDPLIVVDFEGTIQVVNHATLHLLGYAKEDIIGKPVGMIFKLKEDEIPKKTRLQELTKEGFIRDYKTKSGEKIPVGLYTSIMRDRKGKMLGYVCVARDMRQINRLVVDLEKAKAELEEWSGTLEKKVEERTKELKQSRDYTEKIISSLNDSLIVLNPDMTIRTVSCFTLELLGYEEGELLNQSIRKIFPTPEKYDTCFDDGFWGELAQRSRMNNVQKVFQTKDGGKIPVLFSSSVMRDENGLALGIVCIARDISEHKKIMDRLSRANEEIKSFASIVSHDLRSPLVNLKGFSHELKEALREIKGIFEEQSPHLADGLRLRGEELLRDDIPEALDFIETSTSAMERLISHILTLSRIGSRTLIPVEIDTHEFVSNKLKIFKYQIESKHIRVTVKELPCVVADESALDQIFGNILSNAINYLDPGRSGEIEISGERRKGDTLFTIKDNGRGIAAEDCHKVFELFRRAGKPTVPGEGIGLCYVKALVERHGGEIWFESREGVGTAFYFTISGVSDGLS